MRPKKSNPTISVIFMPDDLSLIAYEAVKTSVTSFGLRGNVLQNARRVNNSQVVGCHAEAQWDVRYPFVAAARSPL
jgi:hypothetical protein